MSIEAENAKSNEFAEIICVIPEQTGELLISLFNEVFGRVDKIDREEYENLKTKLYDNPKFRVMHDYQEEVEHVFQIIVEFDDIHRKRMN
jgi:hypothetical protein